MRSDLSSSENSKRMCLCYACYPLTLLCHPVWRWKIKGSKNYFLFWSFKLITSEARSEWMHSVYKMRCCAACHRGSKKACQGSTPYGPMTPIHRVFFIQYSSIHIYEGVFWWPRSWRGKLGFWRLEPQSMCHSTSGTSAQYLYPGTSQQLPHQHGMLVERFGAVENKPYTIPPILVYWIFFGPFTQVCKTEHPCNSANGPYTGRICAIMQILPHVE